jgi:hypothetical protein
MKMNKKAGVDDGRRKNKGNPNSAIAARKKTPELIERILKKVREDCCKKAALARFARINVATLNNWLESDEHFREEYTKAMDKHFENLRPVAQVSLQKLAAGYEYITERTIYCDDGTGEAMIKEKVQEKHYVKPDLDAITFILTNINPEKFQN